MVEIENLCSVVLLHEHPELLTNCSEFLNTFWKRSTTARFISLEKSCKELPDSLVLLTKSTIGESIIGHSRLTRVLEDSNGCWIGSVLISEDKRGQGFGKYLMRKTEEYAKLLGFTVVYLNTKDQEGFYKCIGYTYCEAVSSVSFKWNGFRATKVSSDTIKKHATVKESNIDTIKLPSENNNTSINIPVPPPLPDNKNVLQKSNLGHIWMKKYLISVV